MRILNAIVVQATGEYLPLLKLSLKSNGHLTQTTKSEVHLLLEFIYVAFFISFTGAGGGRSVHVCVCVCVCVCGVGAWGEVTCGQCIDLTGALIVHKRGLGFVGGDIR